MHSLCKPKTRLPKMVQDISKISLLCSYSIYLSRHESTWTSVEPLRARKWAVTFLPITILPVLIFISTYDSYLCMTENMWRQVCVKLKWLLCQITSFCTFCSDCYCLQLVAFYLTIKGLLSLNKGIYLNISFLAFFLRTFWLFLFFKL